MIVSILWHHAQPALLFLVPFTLIPTFLVSLCFKEFRLLWDTVEQESEVRPEKQV